MAIGARGDYQWVTSEQHYLDDIVRLCPEVLLGRYLAVTSTDSGDPARWAKELSGWECRGGVAYSPRLESIEGIDYQVHGRGNGGFDEWYLFEVPADLGGEIVALVNYYFSPDLANDARSVIFWEQIEKFQPESYISDGSECVTFVSRNAGLFQSVCEAFAIAEVRID